MNVPIGFALPEGLTHPDQVLAIVGGAVAGGFLVGLLAQLLCRTMTKKKLPRVPTMVVRIAGGLLCGLLTAMWVWHGGGWGPGGPGGPGGQTAGESNQNPDNGQTKNPQNQPADKDKSPPPRTSVLRLEVLNDDDVRKAAGGAAAGDQAVKDKRFYRVVGETGEPGLLDLAAMKKRIKTRLGEQPALTKVDVVTGPNSPDRTAGRVTELRDAIFDLDTHLQVDYPPQ